MTKLRLFLITAFLFISSSSCLSFQAERSSGDTVAIQIGYDLDIHKYNILLVSGSEHEKSYSAKILSIVCDNSSFKYAVQALEDKDIEVRRNAIYILGKIGDKRAIEQMLKIAKTDHRRMYRDNFTGFDVTISDLTRKALFQGIKDMPSEPFISLLNSSDVIHRSIGVEALGRISDIDSEVLLLRFINDSDFRIRKAAVKALGYKVKTNPYLVKYLVKALDDINPDVRSEAIVGLETGGVHENIDKLLSLLAKEHNWRVQSFIMRALRNVQDKRVVIAMTKYLDSWWYHLRYDAARNLSEYSTEEAYAPLRKLLKDSDSELREFALIGIAKLKNEHSLGLALEFFKSDDKEKRVSGAKALGEIGDNSVVELMIDRHDKEPIGYVGNAIIKSLGNIGDDRAAPLLIKVIESKSQWTRQEHYDKTEAAISLVNIIGQEAAEYLLPLLDYYHPATRIKAIELLAEIGSDDYVLPISAKLKDRNHIVRNSAVAALGEIGGYKSAAALIGSLNDAYPPARRGAVDSLKKITGQDYGHDKESWQKWWEENKHKYEQLEDSSAPDVGTKAPTAAPAQ